MNSEGGHPKSKKDNKLRLLKKNGLKGLFYWPKIRSYIDFFNPQLCPRVISVSQIKVNKITECLSKIIHYNGR